MGKKLFLYSTNTYLKYHIQQHYFGDVHRVWCSEEFDSQALSRSAAGKNTPPSSNPAGIHRLLCDEVSSADTHSAKIASQRASFNDLAAKWEASGKITARQREDITYIVNNPAYLTYWRPLIYIIPRALVEARLEPVPAALCAGLADEYIIPDLAGHEFDFIEPRMF